MKRELLEKSENDESEKLLLFLYHGRSQGREAGPTSLNFKVMYYLTIILSTQALKYNTNTNHEIIMYHLTTRTIHYQSLK